MKTRRACAVPLLLACQLIAGVGQTFATESTAPIASPVKETSMQSKTPRVNDDPDLHRRILGYFPAGNAAADCLSASAGKPFLTRTFALSGRCKRLDDSSEECAYHDYRKLDLSNIAGFDQRGIDSHQVTFPGTEHLWAALSVRNQSASRFCWVGGAHVGQNPLAMTWGGKTGTKKRKNNFILSEAGLVQVESARIHNLHDLFLASGPDAGFSINNSWITWNRDDLFEGYLHNLSFTDTLIDGTYTFISDPDGECDEVKKASDRTIVIENSLIRLQRMPGPFARHTGKWDWAIEGGHNTLWKLDSCDWDEWPAFILKNNVFLIEGPRTTFKQLNTVDCRLALPGICADPHLHKLKECHNNLFLYTGYHHWRKAGSQPGPIPQPGKRFYNAGNPDYLPNGQDCYQKLTDDLPQTGSADVVSIWKALRQQWIDRHTHADSASTTLMTIPGVDYPVFKSGSKIRLINRQSGMCATAQNQLNIRMQECDKSEQQLFTVTAFKDGMLSAAVLLQGDNVGYLRSESTALLESRTDKRQAVAILGAGATEDVPAFAERWYIAPLPDSPETKGFFYIETDSIQRSFLRQHGNDIGFQALFADDTRTALPQDRFNTGNDHHLQWLIQIVEKS
ncbi:MAG: hypothetical protein AB8B87_10700 [Granulosicoccus sp.]